MPEERADRTPYLGLLAVMQQKVDVEDWSVPFSNVIRTDAALAALADAPRTGVVPLVAPASAPTAAVSATTGSLPAGQTWGVVQTFIDAYGRETAAGSEATVSTGTGITDPDTAATFGAIADNGADGYEGGHLEIWYVWTDGAGGETLPSPVVTTEIPYLAAGAKSSVVVNLPSDAATAGAAGANIYLRHRGGNIVQAYRIETDSVSTCTLVGAVANCYLSLPTSNTTDSNHALDITGVAPVGDAAVTTRFYLRLGSEAWTTADRRLRLSSVDEWDPATVTYPLVFAGESFAPGFPPTTSQVKAIRIVDLATEVSGELSESNLPGTLARDLEVATLLGGPYVLTGLLVEAQASPGMTVKTSTGWAISDQRIWNPSADASIAIATAHATNPRIDIVCVNTSGAIVSSGEDTACKGTAAGSPAQPSTPAHYVLLASISVPANDTTISTGQITDARGLKPSLFDLDTALDTHVADTVHSSATYSETNTGTDATKKVTPDGLAGSYAGTKSVSLVVIAATDPVSAGDNQMYFPIPPALNGMNLVFANAIVNLYGTTGATTIDIYNVTDSHDMLSTAISIASGDLIGTPGSVDASYDDVATNDVLRIDVTTASTTPATGLMVMLEFRLP